MAKLKTVHLRDQDTEITAYLDGLKNFSDWVRRKAEDDIVKQRTGVDPEIAAYIDRVLEVKLASCTISADRTGEDVPEVEDAVKGDIEKMF